MKIILCSLVLISTVVWSKTTINFNQALQEDVQKEVKDDEKFKKEAIRGPASVEIEQKEPLNEPSRLDKNIRQIGPNRW